MKDVCKYCQKETEVDFFENPYTHEIHATCDKCKASMSKYVHERIFFAKMGCIGTVVLVIISIIAFIWINWQIGVLFICLGVVTGVGSNMLLQYFINKRAKALGEYVDVKKIKWCKTCKYYRRSRGYESNLRRSERIINDSQIPCQILQDTRQLWINYYNLETGERALYPKNCGSWSKNRLLMLIQRRLNIEAKWLNTPTTRTQLEFFPPKARNNTHTAKIHSIYIDTQALI